MEKPRNGRPDSIQPALEHVWHGNRNKAENSSLRPPPRKPRKKSSGGIKILTISPPFSIIRWRVIDEVWNGQSAIDAVVLVEVGKQHDFGAAQGVGGVHALDQALRQVLTKHFPFLEGVDLVELYTHRGGAGTAAEVVSIMKFGDGRRQWSTMRQSRDLLESAWLALIDGYEWIIVKSRQKKMAR